MEGCVFCSVVAGDTAAHVVLDTPEVVAFLDRSPVFRGHVLVVPRAHVPALPELPDELLVPFFGAVRAIAAAMPVALDAHGTFVAMNNVVSQSVPHLHAHVVPRRRKDGLRGFFWPRVKYASDAEAVEYATRLRVALRGH
jgi:histidine triad (HIT) family protein